MSGKRQNPAGGYSQQTNKGSKKQNTYKSNDYEDEEKQYILDHQLKQKLLRDKKVFQIPLKDYKIYFPYQKLSQPQQILISDIFDCLDHGGNYLAQSSTGSGKTLTLLMATLVWADKKYQKARKHYQREITLLKEKLKNQQISFESYRSKVYSLKCQLRQKKIKVIYTSRAQYQLSQIQRQLQRTPYRPRMLIFGSRQYLCTNKDIIQKLGKKQKKQYEDWYHQCNIATRIQKRFLKKPLQYYNQIKNIKSYIFKFISQINVTYNKEIQFRDQLKNNQYFQKFQDVNQGQVQQSQQYQYFMNQAFKTIQKYLNCHKIKKDQRDTLKTTYDNLKLFQKRCIYFHQYDQGSSSPDNILYQKIDRQVMNIENLKNYSLNVKPTTCLYNYPKRVKNKGTLYLMPYNYLLDKKILSYSTYFIKNSIIIFDQGHNVPNSACQGYSTNFQLSNLLQANSNLGKQYTDQNITIDQAQEQKMLNVFYQQKKQEEEKKFPQIKFQTHQNKFQFKNTSEKIKQINQKTQEQLIHQLKLIIQQQINSYKQYFKKQRTDFKRPYAFKNSQQQINQFNNEQLKNFYKKQQLIRIFHTSQTKKIKKCLTQIFFHKNNQINIQEQINYISILLEKIIEIKKQKEQFYLKLLNCKNFYDSMNAIMHNKDYASKFYIQVIQNAQYKIKSQDIQFKGQINIRCLDPSFAMKKLKEINPLSIIIASGTLSPIDIFQQQIGLQIYNKKTAEQAGYVITQKNILTRVIASDLKKNPLIINSSFFTQNRNLIQLLTLLTQIISSIPSGGVLVVLNSFANLKRLQDFCVSEIGKQYLKKLQQHKPYVVFQPKDNIQTIMNQYKIKANSGKGALLFCVVRAKLSEGIDFRNQLCRSVIFLGIPYLNKYQPFIQQKIQYLHRKESKFRDQWEFSQVAKAINQALGRVVRHEKDYGSIILIDNRYGEALKKYNKYTLNKWENAVMKNISSWIREKMSISNNIKQLQTQLSQFYIEAKKEFKLQKPQEQRQRIIEKIVNYHEQQNYLRNTLLEQVYDYDDYSTEEESCNIFKGREQYISQKRPKKQQSPLDPYYEKQVQQKGQKQIIQALFIKKQQLSESESESQQSNQRLIPQKYNVFPNFNQYQKQNELLIKKQPNLININAQQLFNKRFQKIQKNYKQKGIQIKKLSKEQKQDSLYKIIYKTYTGNKDEKYKQIKKQIINQIWLNSDKYINKIKKKKKYAKYQSDKQKLFQYVNDLQSGKSQGGAIQLKIASKLFKKAYLVYYNQHQSPFLIYDQSVIIGPNNLHPILFLQLGDKRQFHQNITANKREENNQQHNNFIQHFMEAQDQYDQLNYLQEQLDQQILNQRQELSEQAQNRLQNQFKRRNFMNQQVEQFNYNDSKQMQQQQQQQNKQRQKQQQRINKQNQQRKRKQKQYYQKIKQLFENKNKQKQK